MKSLTIILLLFTHSAFAGLSVKAKTPSAIPDSLIYSLDGVNARTMSDEVAHFLSKSEYVGLVKPISLKQAMSDLSRNAKDLAKIEKFAVQNGAQVFKVSSMGASEASGGLAYFFVAQSNDLILSIKN